MPIQATHQNCHLKERSGEGSEFGFFGSSGLRMTRVWVGVQKSFGLVVGLVLVSFGISWAAEAREPIAVLVSLAPYAYLTEKIGGERVAVRTLLPPGADEHLFEPSPSDLLAARKSRIWFQAGTAIEVEIAWAPKILAGAPRMRVVDTAASLPRESKEDPHVWILPQNALVISERILEGLSDADPEGADFYRLRYQKLREELGLLSAELTQKLGPLNGKIIFANHPSWGHLLTGYGLRQEALSEEGKEPGPRRIFELHRRAAAEGVRAIILSPEHPSGPALLLARQSGLKVISRSALSADYSENLLGLAGELSRADEKVAEPAR